MNESRQTMFFSPFLLPLSHSQAHHIPVRNSAIQSDSQQCGIVGSGESQPWIKISEALGLMVLPTPSGGPQTSLLTLWKED